MRLCLRRLCLSATTLCLLGPAISCGTGGLPHTNQVSAMVTPSSATLAPGGSVTLTGTTTGFTASQITDWYIQESKDIDFNNDCGLLTSQNPPTSGCPYGYVMFADVTISPSSATYHAPSTRGTYHVTFEATQFVTFDHVGKTAQATITVQ